MYYLTYKIVLWKFIIIIIVPVFGLHMDTLCLCVSLLPVMPL
jgi:hypothetical protein